MHIYQKYIREGAVLEVKPAHSSARLQKKTRPLTMNAY